MATGYPPPPLPYGAQQPVSSPSPQPGLSSAMGTLSLHASPPYHQEPAKTYGAAFVYELPAAPYHHGAQQPQFQTSPAPSAHSQTAYSASPASRIASPAVQPPYGSHLHASPPPGVQAVQQTLQMANGMYNQHSPPSIPPQAQQAGQYQQAQAFQQPTMASTMSPQTAPNAPLQYAAPPQQQVYTQQPPSQVQGQQYPQYAQQQQQQQQFPLAQQPVQPQHIYQQQQQQQQQQSLYQQQAGAQAQQVRQQPQLQYPYQQQQQLPPLNQQFQQQRPVQQTNVQYPQQQPAPTQQAYVQQQPRYIQQQPPYAQQMPLQPQPQPVQGQVQQVQYLQPQPTGQFQQPQPLQQPPQFQSQQPGQTQSPQQVQPAQQQHHQQIQQHHSGPQPQLSPQHTQNQQQPQQVQAQHSGPQMQLPQQSQQLQQQNSGPQPHLLQQPQQLQQLQPQHTGQRSLSQSPMQLQQLPMPPQSQHQPTFYQPQSIAATQYQTPPPMPIMGAVQPGMQLVYQQPQLQQAQLQPGVVAYPAQQQVQYQQPQQVQYKQAKPRVPTAGATQMAAAQAMANGFRRAFGGVDKRNRNYVGSVPSATVPANPAQAQYGGPPALVYGNTQVPAAVAPVSSQPMLMQQYANGAPAPIQFAQQGQEQPAPVNHGVNLQGLGSQNGAYRNPQEPLATIVRRPVVGYGMPPPVDGQHGNTPVGNINPAGQHSTFATQAQTPPVSALINTPELPQYRLDRGAPAASSVPAPAASISPPAFLHNSPGIFPGFLDSHAPSPQLQGSYPYSSQQPAQGALGTTPTQARGEIVVIPSANVKYAGEDTNKANGSSAGIMSYAPKAAVGVAAVAVLSAGAAGAALAVTKQRRRRGGGGGGGGTQDEGQEEEEEVTGDVGGGQDMQTQAPGGEETTATAQGPSGDAVSGTEQQGQDSTEPKVVEDDGQEPAEPKPTEEQQAAGDGEFDTEPKNTDANAQEGASTESSDAANYETAATNGEAADPSTFGYADQSFLGGGFDSAGAQPGYFDSTAAASSAGGPYDPVNTASTNLADDQIARAESTVGGEAGYMDPYAAGYTDPGAAASSDFTSYSDPNTYGGGGGQMAYNPEPAYYTPVDSGGQTFYPPYDPMQQQLQQEQAYTYADQGGQQQMAYADPYATAAPVGEDGGFAAVVGDDGGAAAAAESSVAAAAEGGGGVDWGGMLDSISSWGL